MEILTCISPGHLEYGRAAEPEPAAERAIIKIRRIGICGTDLHAYEGTQPYFTYPRVLGHELSGELVDPGGAPGFEKGEILTFIPYFSCGTCIACRSGKPNCCTGIKVCGVHINGGMAGYLSVPSSSLVHGKGLSEDALALVEPLAIGAHGVRRAGMQAGEWALVIGAGPIGLGVMEFARIAGAKVIAADVSDSRLDFCRNALKGTLTVNPRREDMGVRLREITDGDMPTAVFDATGNLGAINQGFQYMAHGARYVLVGLQKGDIQFSHPEFHKREATLMSSRNATREDFEQVITCIREKQVDPTAYITHRVGFGQVKSEFGTWLDPANGVIKAIVEMNV